MKMMAHHGLTVIKNEKDEEEELKRMMLIVPLRVTAVTARNSVA